MKRIIFDIEADGLIENATKIHCLCWTDFDTGEIGQITNYSDMRKLIVLPENLTVIGHKIITYDVPMLEKFLHIDMSNIRQVDTLVLSQYLFPTMLKHGLEVWGEIFGIEKPEIDIWIDDGTPDFTARMLHRCSEDVKINTKLFEHEIEYLSKIYTNLGDIKKPIAYLGHKAKCAREQEEQKLRIDIEKTKTNLSMLQGKAAEKIEILKTIMPRVKVYQIKSKPKVFNKQDGSISKLGEDWLKFLKKRKLPEYHNGAVKFIKTTKDPNPKSHQQLKEWLFSLGWVPTTFKWVREKDANGVTDYGQPARQIPQLASDDNTGLCQSVKDLFEKESKLEELESLFVINHRIGILEGFLENVDINGFLKAEVSGFTNTLRFTHKKPIVNLPQIPKLYWKEVRECIIAPEGHILCNTDMSGLEDRTKMHYIYFYDPEYVNAMMSEDFDPHLYIAVKAGLLAQEEVDWYKAYEKRKKECEDQKIEFITTPEEKAKHSRIKGIRLKAKKTNFAAIYGAGAPKIAVTANIPLKESVIFYNAYWKVNWSIKKIVENTIVQEMDNGQMWLWNPVAEMWYSLKTMKDIFSTLNQGTGDYAFNVYVKHCRAKGYKICMQYHDEHTSARLIGTEEETKKILNESIRETNEELQLNIQLGISIEFGYNYADTH